MAAGRVRARPKKIGSRWRTLPPGRIALIVPAVLRHDQRLSGLAGACQVSASTVRRWLLEAVHLLAARAERLDGALKKTVKRGGTVVPIDSMLIPVRRRTGTDDRPDYSDKRKMHGLHVLALTDDEDNLIRGLGRPARAAPTTSPPPVTTTSPPICARPGSGGLRPRLPRPGRRSGQPRHHHRLPRRPRAPSHRCEEGSEQARGPRTRGERARVRRLEELARAHQAPPGRPARDRAAAGPARPHPRRSRPVTTITRTDQGRDGVEPSTSFPGSLVGLRIRS